MIRPEELVIGERYQSSMGWDVEVVGVTESGIVQWRFTDDRNDYVYGAPLKWVYDAWTLA